MLCYTQNLKLKQKKGWLAVQANEAISGIAECKYEFPSSPTLLPKEKGARILVPSPVGRGLG